MADLLSGKLSIIYPAINTGESLYWDDGKSVIVDTNPDILNLDHWKNSEAFGDLSYREINYPLASNILDCKIRIIDASTDQLDGEIVLGSKEITILDGNIEIIFTQPDIGESVYWDNGEPITITTKTGVPNLQYWDNGDSFGDLTYRDRIILILSSISSLNGKVLVRDGNYDLFDGEITLKIPTNTPNLFDGKSEVLKKAYGLVKIKIY